MRFKDLKKGDTFCLTDSKGNKSIWKKLNSKPASSGYNAVQVDGVHESGLMRTYKGCPMGIKPSLEVKVCKK